MLAFVPFSWPWAGLAERSLFLAAEKALDKKQYVVFDTLHRQLKDYPLSPYLRARWLGLRLGEERRQAKAFLAKHGSTPVTFNLRRKYLTLLAAEGRWKAFLRAYVPTANVRLRCLYAHALWRTDQTAAAAKQTQSLWMHGKSRPDACNAAFERWKASKGLTAELTLRRLVLAVRAGKLGLAKYLRRTLPVKYQRVADTWLSLRGSPESITRIAPAAPTNRGMAGYAMRRMAAADSRKAAAFWRAERVRREYPRAEQLEADQKIGLYLATDHDPLAPVWLADIKEMPGACNSSCEKVREWRVSSALRTEDWQRVRAALTRLPKAIADQPRWLYWRGRSAEIARQPAARAWFARAAADRDYYGFLAADRLARPYSLNNASTPPTQSQIAAFSKGPGARRAQELLLLDRLEQARREWLHLLRKTGGNRAEMVLAAYVAHAWEWHGMAIMTLGRSRAFDQLNARYPRPYDSLIGREAKRAGIDALWARSIMRQESAYMRRARSSADARGLMQLLPATARSVARSLGTRLRKTSALYDPAVNIRFGVTYLKQMLAKMDGHIALATAAYNAGPHRIPNWLHKETPLDADIWIDTIPYTETRNYVKAVLAHQITYALLGGTQPTRLNEVLPPVPVRARIAKKK
ncbi:MAG: transglycosylase SLT domain-containing protein [Chromatiales bacterium]|nr:transglycosylase SLT domain-containing protein [Chromatiales bacterium]